VLRMESVAESVADNLVGHYPGVPRLGQAKQTGASASRLIHRLHGQRISARHNEIVPRHSSVRPLVCPVDKGAGPLRAGPSFPFWSLHAAPYKPTTGIKDRATPPPP